MNKKELIELLGEEKGLEVFNQIEETSKEVKQLQKTLGAKEKEIGDLQSKLEKTNEDYKSQLDEKDKLLSASGDNIKALEDSKKEMMKQNAIDLALTKANCRNLVATKSLMDMEQVTIDDKGVVSGVNELVENVKKDNEYLFDNGTFVGNQGVPSNNEPQTTPNENMTYDELCKVLK